MAIWFDTMQARQPCLVRSEIFAERLLRVCSVPYMNTTSSGGRCAISRPTTTGVDFCLYQGPHPLFVLPRPSDKQFNWHSKTSQSTFKPIPALKHHLQPLPNHPKTIKHGPLWKLQLLQWRSLLWLVLLQHLWRTSRSVPSPSPVPRLPCHYCCFPSRFPR